MVDVTEGIYDVGTVSIENGSDQLIGTGTFWLATGERYDEVYLAGERVLVKSIDADGVATLAMPWTAATVEDASYVWSFRSQLRIDPSMTQAKIRDLIAFYKMGGVRGTREVTAAIDAIVVDDLNKAIVYDRGTAIAVSIAQAGGAGQFVDGWATWLKNEGPGKVTITPAGSTINGGGMLELAEGAAAFLWSHDGNYLAAVYAVTGGLAIGAAGPLANRTAFNAQPPGFTYFGSDTELLYVRLTSGGWSGGTAVIGTAGADGEDGWTPIISIVADGARRVARVVDWTGGTGTKPATGKYIGVAGLVDNVADGVNVRGPDGAPGGTGPANSLTIGTVTGGPAASAEITGAAPTQTLNLVLPKGDEGDDGWSPVFAVVTDAARRVLQVTDWVGGVGTKPAIGKYVGATGFEALIANGVDIRGATGAAGAGSGDMEKSIYDPDDNGKFANAQLEDMAQGTVKMRRAGAGSGAPTDITLANLKTDLALNAVTNDAQIPLSYLDTDTTLAANSDVKVATQKAIKAYADNLIAANDAMVFKGAINCSANPNYPAADAGWTYKVSVAGKVGGASGPNVEVGDTLLCTADGSAAGNHATVGANWNIVQANLDGVTVGPSSAADGTPAVFDGVSGRLLKNITYAAFKALLSLVKGDVGLGNVDNTSDVNKPVSTAQAAADALKSNITRTRRKCCDYEQRQ